MSKKNKLKRFADLQTYPNVYENLDPRNPELTGVDGETVDLKGKWSQQHFKNNLPITLELACGKGHYTLELARRFPNRNFIGIDIKGARIWKGANIGLDEKISNAAFFRTRIEQLELFFDKDEVDEIWITFPDPFLKSSKSNRRLTASPFLKRYKNILKDEGLIHLKTDSTELYDFTLEVLENESDYELLYFDDDIYAKPLPEEALDIKTEYEGIHLAKKKTIKYVRIKKKPSKNINKNDMDIQSKLPNVGTNIFTVMSGLANEHDAINLSQGFPNFDCAPELKNLVNKYLQSGHNQYAPMGGVNVLLQQLARKIQNLYGASLNPKTEITITAGATQALFTAITAFVHAGDEVIVIEPAYDCYAPAIEICGGVVVPYQMTMPDFKIDWKELQQLISPKTKMLIINTPHNPTGTILREEDLKIVEKIAEENDLIVLSDEVYEHLIFDKEEHQSVLRFPKLFQRSLATYSFGKTFHGTGWKMGYCVAPEHLMREFRKIHQFNVFSVNTFVQHAIAEYLEDESNYLSLNNFYQQKRDFFLDKIKDSKFRPIPCGGTYFQLVDYSAISDEPELDFAKKMTKEFGVAVIPISAFYTNNLNQKVVRVCFAKTEGLLAEAAELLCKM